MTEGGWLDDQGTPDASPSPGPPTPPAASPHAPSGFEAEDDHGRRVLFAVAIVSIVAVLAVVLAAVSLVVLARS